MLRSVRMLNWRSMSSIWVIVRDLGWPSSVPSPPPLGNVLFVSIFFSNVKRFNRLAWSGQSAASADGVIIGGLEDGSVGFWNASKIIASAPQ